MTRLVLRAGGTRSASPPAMQSRCILLLGLLYGPGVSSQLAVKACGLEPWTQKQDSLPTSLYTHTLPSQPGTPGLATQTRLSPHGGLHTWTGLSPHSSGYTGRPVLTALFIQTNLSPTVLCTQTDRPVPSWPCTHRQACLHRTWSPRCLSESEMRPH